MRRSTRCFAEPMGTVWPVLTEGMYLLAKDLRASEAV